MGKWQNILYEANRKKIEDKIEDKIKDKIKDKGTDPTPIPVWFNPWRYSKEEHLIIPFLKTIAASLNAYSKKDDSGGGIKKYTKDAAQDISNAARAIAYGAKLNFFGIALSGKDAIEREEKLKAQQEDEITKDQEEMKDIYYGIIDHLQRAVTGKAFRLVVFIDDLDRCIPEKAVELLESMKLFLDLKGYLFILGVDRAVVEEGILHHYKYNHDDGSSVEKGKALAGKYLEKMIQMGMELPPVEPTRKRSFIEKLLENSKLQEYSQIIEYGLTDRPRDITRFINYLAFFCRLAENLKEGIAGEPADSGKPENWSELIKKHFTPQYYAKWAIFQSQFEFEEQRKKVFEATSNFFKLQDQARHENKEPRQEGSDKPRVDIHLPEKLKKVLEYGEPFAENAWLIRKFIYLANSVPIINSESVQAKTAPGKTKVTGHADSLPAIGETVTVPTGPFLFGDEKDSKSIDYSYEIDIYPVTNDKFCDFLNKYSQVEDNPQTTDGEIIIDFGYSRIEQNESQTAGKKGFSCPQEYDKHPVTGVTWFGAEEYCKWRTKASGDKKSSFRLPTELEWEKAARGDGGYEYPWGNEFNPELCNTKESNVRDTTAVTEYPEGTSPYGCLDMAGNVWEWTSSDYDESFKVLKGGSWYNVDTAVRCAGRDGGPPGLRDDNVGFRCARTIE